MTRRRGPRAFLSGLVARTRDLFLRRSADRDMEEELRFHIDMETDKLVRSGLDPAEARRRALVAFGGVERQRDRLREGRRLPFVEPLLADLRFGFRSLGRQPGLSLVAAVTIAVGVGATTTVFSAVNALLLRPLPLPGVERLVSVIESRRGEVSTGIEGPLIPYDRYLAYRDAAGDVFASLAAHRLDQSVALRLPQATVSVSGTFTSGDYFRTLGVQPVLGRTYASDDAAEAVLSHALWTSRFGRDPDVLGRTIGLDGREVTVVGVAPAGFGGTTLMASEVWAPVGVGARHNAGVRPTLPVVPLGRLRPGVPFERAAAAVDALARRIPPEENVTVQAARLERPSTLPAEARGPAGGFLGMLLGMAVLVLLIAAANIAGVMLARGFARRREIAVRLAMGAGRGRVVRHLLAESLALFAIGGLLGVGLAWLGTGWLARIELPPQAPPVLLDLAPDGRVLAFAALLTGLTGVLFGLAPALRASRPDLIPALKTGTAGSVGGEGGRLRALFVGAQVALAVTLLLTGTLFARSLQMGLRTELGFEPEGVVAATVSLGSPLDYDEDEGRAFFDELLGRVRAQPGVERAGLSRIVLVSGSSSSDNVRRPDAPDVPEVNASYTLVSPDYFETMGIEVLAGRGITEADVRGSPRVAVINRALADRLWPGEIPLGHVIEGFGVEAAEVVGVTGTGRYALITEQPRPFVFLPFAQVYRSSAAIHARAPGAEGATLRAIADEVRSLDPDVALGLSGPLPELIGFALFPQRFAAQLVGAFGLAGLLLAALGIYGVLAFHVARRTRELGVRRALGATRARVIGGVVRQGALIAAAGCVVGLAGGAAAAMAVRSLLVGIRPLDPLTFAAVPVAILAVALLASGLPALRASAVEASQALRWE